MITSQPDRHDVLFYLPAVGSLVSRSGPGPAGGAETQVLTLAKALAARGLRVAMVAYGRPGELPDEVDGVRIVRRAPYLKRGRVIGKIFETAAIWGALWRAPARAIVTRCAGIQVGLVALYGRLTRTPVLYASAAITDFDFTTFEKQRDRLLYRLGIRLVDEIVVQTEEQVALCESAFGRRGTLIKSITSTPRLTAASPEAFLWVGRLATYKQPLEYVALARSLPDAKFWMVGVPQSSGGRELERSVIAAASDVPNLELLPPQSHAEIGELMSRAVACVSTSEFEGMPNVFLEAWSRGIPALALNFDPGGVIRRHRLGGVATGSSRVLCLLAEDLWRNRWDRDDLSARCVAYVAEHHSPDAVAARWSELLGADGVARSRRGQVHPHEPAWTR